MKKYIKILIISFITILSSISLVSAWTWLTAQSGDIITISKWNELVNLLNAKMPTSSATNRDDSNISWTRYYWAGYNDWTWKIDKETWTWTGTIRVTATNVNNSSQSNYSSAWTNRASLNY